MATENEQEKAVSLMLDGPHLARPQDLPRTLLPAPIAAAISLAAKSSSISLQIGTFIARRVLDGARITSLTGLELTRAAVEGVLLSAGNDVMRRSRGELGRGEAEGLLEQSVGPICHARTIKLTRCLA